MVRTRKYSLHTYIQTHIHLGLPNASYIHVFMIIAW